MTDHIPLPPPDHTEDVPGFVHDTQRHYYSEETLRAHAERLHATRANGPAIMQAIGLLAVLQSWIGPRRPEGSEPEGRALWDQIEATRIALMPLAPAGAPTAQAAPQPAVQRGDAEDAASWRALAQPTEETIIEAVEASCAHRPSVDDDSYVLRILRVFTNAARSKVKAD